MSGWWPEDYYEPPTRGEIVLKLLVILAIGAFMVVPYCYGR